MTTRHLCLPAALFAQSAAYSDTNVTWDDAAAVGNESANRRAYRISIANP